MFKLNLKISFRNLFKNKIYAFINIIGLAIGLTAFVFVVLYINHEESYDSWSPELKNVYQIREKHNFFSPDNKAYLQETIDSKIALLLKEKLPQAIAVTKVDADFGSNGGYSIKLDDTAPVLVTKIKDADSNYFHVFPYIFLQGDNETALKSPKSIVLKYSLAQKLFGTDKILGRVVKIVRWREDKGENLTVTGVVEDPELPESAGFNALMRTGNKDNDPTDIFSTNYCQVYIKVNGTTETSVINQNIKNIYADFKKASLAHSSLKIKTLQKDGNGPGLEALAIKQVHANPVFTVNWLTKTNYSYINISATDFYH